MGSLCLVSPLLTFTRSGRHLAISSPSESAVSLVDVREPSSPRLIPVAETINSIIGFPDQLWLGHANGLDRVSLRGEALGGISNLPHTTAPIVAAALGDAAALWPAPTPTAILLEGPNLRTTTLPAGDVILPLTGRRWVSATLSRLVLPSGLGLELEHDARILGGAFVHDGAAVALIVERPFGRELVVVGLANARLAMRRTIPTTPILRVAPRRGVLALVADERTITLLDLRSGRIVGESIVDAPIADLAIDPDAKQFALRDPSGAVTLREVSSGPRAKSAPSAPPVEDRPSPLPGGYQPANVEAVHAVPPSPPEPEVTKRTLAITRPLDLRGLSPRRLDVAVDRDRSLALLDLELRSVSLWALRAISAAWDSRRISFGNEGHHPYEHEVAALLQMNAGFASEHFSSACELLSAHLDGLPSDLRSPSTPVGMLALELGLSPLATEILLVVAGPMLWSEIARLYGILANDPSRGVVDEALVEQLLESRATRYEIAAELDARAPLVRLGILSTSKGRRPFSGLEVHPVILARLRREVPDLGGGLQIRGSDRALEELVVPPTVIEAAISHLSRVQGPARIVARGRAGSGRRTLLAALAAEANRALGIIDVSLLPRDTFIRALAAHLHAAHLAGLLPCIVRLDEITFGERDLRDELMELLRTHPGAIVAVVATGATAPFCSDHLLLDFAALEEHTRVAVWRRALSDAAIGVADPDALAARYRIGPGTIHRAIAAIDRDALDDRDATAPIEAYLRRTRDLRLGDHARRVERLASWDRLVLAPDILDSLRELVARVRHRRTVFETWGMSETMATSRGLTALFSGPPGTGKTLVAGVVARELGLDLYQVDVSKVMSKWLGETERNLAAIFDAAEDGQVVLLFDEADSLFAKRTEVKSSNDRYSNLEVNYLLQRLDSFEGIAILTTNSQKAIDPAFKRRLSFRLSFPFPDEETREELWRAHLPPTLPTAGTLELGRLAHKYQLSGGYIRNACLRAAFLAAVDGSHLHHHHLERAVALEFAELGKLSSSGAID